MAQSCYHSGSSSSTTAECHFIKVINYSIHRKWFCSFLNCSFFEFLILTLLARFIDFYEWPTKCHCHQMAPVLRRMKRALASVLMLILQLLTQTAHAQGLSMNISIASLRSQNCFQMSLNSACSAAKKTLLLSSEIACMLPPFPSMGKKPNPI